MDIIDNLIYASAASPVQPSVAVAGFPAPAAGGPNPANPRAGFRFRSDYIPHPAVPVAGPGPVFNFPMVNKMAFCSFGDADLIESAIQKHWYDVDEQVNYDSDGVRGPFNGQGVANRYVSFELSSTYHLMTAYLLENTRMLQIFERVLEKYGVDEELGIAQNNAAFNWIQNAERLFFRNTSHHTENNRSLIRPNSDANRRNAYWRLLGIDLAFGDPNSQQPALPYTKARTSNQQFVPLFEKFLGEIWQGYINRLNGGNVNTSDVNVMAELAQQLQELLIARRGNPGNTYANQNLSREEFSSTLITQWFMFIISDNTPVVDFLNCQSTSIGERLLKIGAKVGIPAHSRSQSLFEMATAAGQILNIIEIGGVLNNAAVLPVILASLNPAPPAGAMPVLMQALLTVINNWEKATGHKIKTQESYITDSVVRVSKLARGSLAAN